MDDLDAEFGASPLGKSSSRRPLIAGSSHDGNAPSVSAQPEVLHCNVLVRNEFTSQHRCLTLCAYVRTCNAGCQRPVHRPPPALACPPSCIPRRNPSRCGNRCVWRHACRGLHIPENKSSPGWLLLFRFCFLAPSLVPILHIIHLCYSWKPKLESKSKLSNNCNRRSTL